MVMDQRPLKFKPIPERHVSCYDVGFMAIKICFTFHFLSLLCFFFFLIKNLQTRSKKPINNINA